MVPDIRFSPVEYFTDTVFELSKIKDKWTIIDFFDSHCTTCFASFPKVNQLQAKYRDQIQFIIVGNYDKKIRNIYEKFRSHFKLQLPITYDSTIFKKFGIGMVPFIIWLDKNKIVRAITTSADLNEIEIEKMLTNDKYQLQSNQSNHQLSYDKINFKKPLLVDGNGGSDSDFLFRSLLTQSKHYTQFDPYISSRNKNMVQAMGTPLLHLYRLAYGDTIFFHRPKLKYEQDTTTYGDWYLKPIIEVKDTSIFKYEFGTNEKNLFNYSLIVPRDKANPMYLKEIMQRDLKNYFGYNVTVEKRVMPYWKLVATDGAKAKLKTKGEVAIYESDQAGFRYVNQPLSMLIMDLWTFNQSDVFINETGIHNNIDISVDAIMTDFSNVKAALQKKGLNLVEGKKEMTVIIIRDSK
jgi:thiol-disulfide isomerase/thioredoxin